MDFLTQLQKFRAYAWNLNADFGRAVDSVITQHTANSFNGFGDAASDILSAGPITISSPDIAAIADNIDALPVTGNPNIAPPTNIVSTNPAMNVASGIDQLVNGTAKSYLNVMGAYYGTQAQVNNLKAAAGGSVQTQATNTAAKLFGSIPMSFYIFGAIGLIGLLVISGDKKRR